MSTALKVSGVTKSYPGVYALQDVELEVLAGEIHGVVGENGAGKSTLMGVISGAVSPDSGGVWVHEEALELGSAEASRDRGIAIVRQEPALLPDLTVAENIYLGMPKSKRPSPRSLSTWAKKQLERWGDDFVVLPEARVEELPPEHRFIVEIARALAAEPKVLILDEPTEHLAAEDTQRLFSKIRESADNGVAVIYISHRIAEVKQIADRISVLRNGRSQGTQKASDLSESDIINLIVGRELAETFPPKPDIDERAAPRLMVERLSGARFSDVGLFVRPGEVVGLAGIDGNGQREFLRALGGLEANTGRVMLDGRTAKYRGTAQAVDQGIAYVASDRHREGVFGALSVRENVSLRSLHQYATAGFVSAKRETRESRNLLTQFNVKTPSPGSAIATLSGGNQQKAVLAGAFGSSPSVLLLDEPTQGVDVGARSEIYTLIREQAALTGMAVIVLSTDAKELAGIADRVLVFSRGRVVAELEGADVVEAKITGEALRSTVRREKVVSFRSQFTRWLTGDIAPVGMVGAVIILLALVTQILNPYFMSAASLASILTLVATLGIAAIAQSVVMLVGGIDLSIGPLMGFLVVVQSFFLVDGTSAGLQAIGWIIFFGTALVVGVVNWALIDLARMHPMIATLVTFTGLQAVSLILRPTPGGVISRGITSSISAKFGPIPVTFAIVLVLAILLAWWLLRTRSGIALRAIGSEPSLAQVNALRPRLVRLAAYVAASLIAAVGGITLMAQLGSGDPSGGTSYTLQSISAAVVGGIALTGGRGSFIGAIAGAVLIQICASVTTFLGLTTAWQSFLVGGLTIFAVAAYSKTRSTNKVVEP